MTTLSAAKLSALRKIIATPCSLGGRAIAIDQVYVQEVPIYARIKDKPDVVRIAEPHNCPPGFVFAGHKQEVRGRAARFTREQMPDEGETVVDGVAQCLFEMCPAPSRLRGLEYLIKHRNGWGA